MNTDLKPVEPCNDTIDHRWVEFDKKYDNKEPRRIFRNSVMILSLSIVIGSLGCFGYLHFYYPGKTSKIFNKHYERYDVTSSFNCTHVKAISNYGKGNSQEAIRLFNMVPKADSLSIICNFYMALSYIDCNNFKEAVNLLEPITKNDNIYYNPANWYLSLSYVKMYKIQEARNILKRIIEEGSSYRQEASEVLGELEEVTE